MKSLLLFGLILYFGLGVLLYFQQRNFIYLPVPESSNELPTRWISHAGNKLKIYVLPAPTPVPSGEPGNGAVAGANTVQANKAILYFGGNAESVEYNAGDFSRYFPGYTVYLVNYRGYGGSDGRPTEQALYADALVIYDELRLQHAAITVVGRSLGSAVATYAAANRDVDGLVLVTPFDSILNVAQSRFPMYPLSLMLKDRHDSLGRAADIKANTLVLAAELDRVIKPRHTQRLVDGLKTNVAFHVLDGVGHNDVSMHPAYYPLFVDFLAELP